MTDIRIRPAAPADGAQLASIYSHYVLHTTVTFEEEAVTGEAMGHRVMEASNVNLPFLVAESGSTLFGFAYASRWKGRCAYRFSAETTVYIRPTDVGRGLGSALYGSLLPILRTGGIHTAIGGIALPNEASVALHEKFGFRETAVFREVGYKCNRWVDVGYWQLIISA